MTVADTLTVADFLESDSKHRVLFAPMISYAHFVQRFFGVFPGCQYRVSPCINKREQFPDSQSGDGARLTVVNF
jgi:hypothetical protein